MAQESFDSLAAAVMQAESRGQRFDAKGQLTTSSKGAEGEMQVMPRTQVRPGYGVAPAQDRSPQEIARVGKDYLKAMLDKYGEREKALIAYNWGPGNTDKWLEKGGDPKKVPAETRSYVAKVDSILSGGGTKSVVREDVQPMMEKALQSGQTAAAPQAAPTSSKLEAMGPSYQAALALAMLSSEDEREGRDPEDKDNEEKTAEARKWLEDMQEMESGPRPTALAGLELNSLNAFAQPQAAQARPQGMAAGGVPYTPTAMASSTARAQLAQLKLYDTQAKGYNASLDKYNKEFYEPYVANVNKYNAQIAAGNTNPDSFYTPAPFDMPAPKAPMDQAQTTQFMANTKKDVANRQLALNVAADPEQYGLSMGKFFADGGAVYRAEGSPSEGEQAGPTRSAKELDAYMQSMVPGVKQVSEPSFTGTGVKGMIYSDEALRAKNPRMLIRPGLEKGDDEIVKLHELNHIMDNRGGDLLGRPNHGGMDNNYRAYYMMGERWRPLTDFVSSTINNKDKLEKFFGRTIPEGGGFVNKDQFNEMVKKGFDSRALFKEQLATLSGYEEATGKSITRDPETRKIFDAVSHPYHMMSVYDSLTGPRQTRMDAKDLAPHTPLPANTYVENPISKFLYSGSTFKYPVKRAEGSPSEGELSAEEIERYSRPAFVTPGSGIGRKAGNISEGLASGEGYREAAKGLTMMPANLAGAPADLYNFTVRRAMGTDVDKPVGGSENIKEFLRDKGLAFKPPEDPKLKGFFEAGDLASNLINPAAVTRGVVSGAAKAGQAVGSAAKQLKEMGKPASVTEAVPTYRPQDTIDEITRATGVAPPANPDGWNVIDVGGELPSSPVQLLNIAPANRVAPPVGLPPPDYLPNGVRPFVGKLDAFVDEMKNPVRLDQFMGQIQGKFRSYDIERVERAFEGMDPKTKLTPDQIKQALDKNYSPSKWVSETIPPNPDRNPHGEVDNVWKVPLGTTNLYLEQPASSIEAAGAFSLVLNKLRPLVRIGDLAPTVKDLAVARETLSNKAVLNNADPKIINELSTKIDKVEKNVQIMQDLMGSVKNINKGFVEPTAYVDAVAAGKGNTSFDQPYWKFHNEAFYNELTAKVDQARARAIADGKSPAKAADAAIAVYDDEVLRINANKNAEIIAIKKVQELALKEAARLGIPAPDFSLINWSAQDGQKNNAWLKTGNNLPFKVSVDLALEPSFQTLNEQSKKVKRYLAKDVGDLQASMTLPNLETGKHQAVAGKPYPIAFTRFSEHEAVIDPSIGKVQGRHFHELQSDLYNALTKKGAVTSSASKDAKEIKELGQQYAKHQDAMVAETRKLGPLPLSSEPMSPEYWAKRDVIDKKFKESVQGIEQRKKILTDRVARYGDTNKTVDYSVQEPFAGFEKGSDLRRQMLIKNAVYSSMHDGKSFATFPGAESSKSELYVGKIYPNLKQVAKDLGGQKAGLEVRQIELPPDAKGNPVTAWGIAWSPETAARIVKQGVPFAKGGMVERETADNRKYL